MVADRLPDSKFHTQLDDGHDRLREGRLSRRQLEADDPAALQSSHG